MSFTYYFSEFANTTFDTPFTMGNSIYNVLTSDLQFFSTSKATRLPDKVNVNDNQDYL